MLRSCSRRMEGPRISLGKQGSARGFCPCFGEDGQEDSLGSSRSWLGGGRKSMSSGSESEYSSWWQKGWNSVRKAGEWSETVIEEAGSRSGPKWRLFVRKLKNEGRSIYPRKPVRCQYDAISYSQNFDEGTWQESENPYQGFSARFAAPLHKPSEA